MSSSASRLQTPERVWLHSRRPGPLGRSYRFEEPAGELVAETVAEVPDLLARAEASVRAGLHAVVLVSYEAAGAFDSALLTHTPSAQVPAWIGLYRRRRALAAVDGLPANGAFELGAWSPSISRAQHAEALRRIRSYIAAGDTYQVNYTFPVEAAFTGDAVAFYRQLCAAQGAAAFCAFLDFGGTAALSASPELFFRLDGDGTIETRPMKGTRPRGRWAAEDDCLARDLATSEKDRAENVMIVDLLRNDLGRVAVPGSVAVPALWQTEAYDTVWQMTSTVRARLRDEVALVDLFAALFPCGSVTGAPKVRAMQIIAELERGPRGVYTGTLGYLSPSPGQGSGRLAGIEARFSVAIRTVTVDRQAGRARAGVGGGITWGSEAGAEYEECLHKARFLHTRRPSFELLETLLYEPEAGYLLLDRHLQRLLDSVRYFGWPVEGTSLRERVCSRLRDAVADVREPWRVRLTLNRAGAIEVAGAAMVPVREPLRVLLAERPVDDGNVLLYHKTTHRRVYDEALAAARARGAGEVLLHNRRGEVTETSIGNLVVELDGQRWTPPVSCGLLPGTQRAALLDAGELAERVLTIADVNERAQALYSINSVRPWVRLEWLETTGAQIPAGGTAAAVSTCGKESSRVPHR